MRTNIASVAQLTRETNKPWCIANTINHNAMQGTGAWALLSDLNNPRPCCHVLLLVFCCFAKLIQSKSATSQRFQLAFKRLLLLEKNSRLHPIFQDFAFNFQTFSRSRKVVCKFPYFFKNSRLCTNPVYKWIMANCGGNLTSCGEVTCDGLASHPGEVEILLAASCYRNRD